MRGIDFEVAAGEVFGLLGPNGAGKTTTVEILEGYRQRDGGEVTVLGFDPGRAERAFRERIGVVLQSSELWPNLTVREVTAMFAGYYERAARRRRGDRARRPGEKRDARVKTLSGGQKRRLDLGVALVGDPDLVFLDEPTTGFDPAARRNAWDSIRSLRELGKTVLLTTHYLDEAQQLADRVAVLRAGEIVSSARPSELIGATRRPRSATGETASSWSSRRDEPTRVLHELTAAALAAGASSTASRCGGDLEDVYLALVARRTGRERSSSTSSASSSSLFWRSREAAFFIFIFPIMLFVLLGSVYGDGDYRGSPADDYLLAGMLGYGAANTAFAGLAITLVLRREAGILKRLRSTPLPARSTSRPCSPRASSSSPSRRSCSSCWAGSLFDAELPARTALAWRDPGVRHDGVRRPRRRRGRADPLGGGRSAVVNVVLLHVLPLGLLRQPRLSRVPRGDRRRAAAPALHRL